MLRGTGVREAGAVTDSGVEEEVLAVLEAGGEEMAEGRADRSQRSAGLPCKSLSFSVQTKLHSQQRSKLSKKLTACSVVR